MLIVADVHGATEALRRVASLGEPLLVLGDLINFIDYRTNEGIAAEVLGRPFVAELVRRRTGGDFTGAAELWSEAAAGRGDQLRTAFDERIDAAYAEVCAALDGAEAYVTYGNVDRPDLLRHHLPTSARFVDGDVVEIEGMQVGIVGGGAVSLGTPGEVSEADMAAKLAALGPVEILCTHVPPAVPALARDVIGGRAKWFTAVLDYLVAHRPTHHYFGDVHQPQALTWRIADTRCRNVGYFRATGRPARHRSPGR